jgi:hypothetical protein
MSPGFTAPGSGPPCSTTADPPVGNVRREQSGIVLTLDPIQVAILEQLIGEVVDFVAARVERTESAGWARELGLEGVGEPELGSPPPPKDPVTARLFPDAYPDDEEAAGDFRRFTGDELRAGKAANAKKLLSALPEGGGSITLDEDASSAWLGALNDARLALGTALDVNENTNYEFVTLATDEPRAQRLIVYAWLGELQEAMLEALMDD